MPTQPPIPATSPITSLTSPNSSTLPNPPVPSERTTTGGVIHAYNKSIAHFVIYTTHDEYLRCIAMMLYYQFENPGQSFSRLLRDAPRKTPPTEASHDPRGKPDPLATAIDAVRGKTRRALLIAYCLMPTHIHLILEEIRPGAVKDCMSDLENAYARYFNIKHERKGPLWQGRFKRSGIFSDRELLNVTRYVHLNPATSYLVNDPGAWPYSSFHEHTRQTGLPGICSWEHRMTVVPEEYGRFVRDYVETQRALARERK